MLGQPDTLPYPFHGPFEPDRLRVEFHRLGNDTIMDGNRRRGAVEKVVDGVWMTPEAQEPARAYNVWQVTNGRLTLLATA